MCKVLDILRQGLDFAIEVLNLATDVIVCARVVPDSEGLDISRNSGPVSIPEPEPEPHLGISSPGNLLPRKEQRKHGRLAL